MKFIVFILALLIVPSYGVIAAESKKVNTLTDHEQWLKNKFNSQHTKLIPVVAVSDMLFICNREKNNAYGKHTLNTLITKMSKERLAEKLSSCLGDESVNSDTAVNYGLLGCFHDQLSRLSKAEREEKIKLVKQAIHSLSKDERKKSFTQCVTDQSIGYLQ